MCILHFLRLIKNAKYNFEIYPEMISQGEKGRCKEEFESRNFNSSDSNFERCFSMRVYELASLCSSLIVAPVHHLSLNGSAFLNDKVSRVLHSLTIFDVAVAQSLSRNIP